MWQKLRKLTASDWLALAQSALLLPALNLALRRLRLDRVQSWLAARSHDAVEESFADHAAARDLARLVDAVARRTPFASNCLHRSLTTWFLLRRRGIGSTLRFGVRPDDPPAFHAWLEIEGQVVNDSANIAAVYLPFPSAIEPSQTRAFD
jgi:hypothetical protein